MVEFSNDFIIEENLDDQHKRLMEKLKKRRENWINMSVSKVMSSRIVALNTKELDLETIQEPQKEESGKPIFKAKTPTLNWDGWVYDDGNILAEIEESKNAT